MNISLPLISVITPSYNAMPHIKATIESVLAQNYSKLEHIIIDGNSTDGSLEIFKKYRHLNWTSEKDRGQSHALNKGFAKATGEIIGWLNADDTYTPGTFKKVIDYFNHHPETDLIGTDINIIDENGNVVGMSPGGPLDKVELLILNKIKQPSVFMRRRVIDTLKGVDESLHFVMDQEFWLRVALNGFKYDHIANERFANFRLIQGTKTFEMGIKFREEWHECIMKSLKRAEFKEVSADVKLKILEASIADLHFQKMISCGIKGKKIDVLKSARTALMSGSSLKYNLGFYKILFNLLIGKGYNQIKRYQNKKS